MASACAAITLTATIVVASATWKTTAWAFDTDAQKGHLDPSAPSTTRQMFDRNFDCQNPS